MHYSPRTLRITGSSLIAVLMVAGAYSFSGTNPLFGARSASAQSAEELLREYAGKDSDSDLLPDWQEALYGTDPMNPESFKEGVLDGDAVAQGLIEPKVTVREDDAPTDISTIPGASALPNSLTDRFAQTLLKQYLQNRGETPPTTAEIVAFVEKGIANLSTESISAPKYAASDVRTTGESGTLALTNYAGQMEAAFGNNTVPTSKNELSYFADALKEDASALRKIEDISDAYANIAAAVMKIPVPAEARQAHLSVANALVHMSEINADMAALKSDPLRSLMGIGLYDRHARELVSGFSNLSSVFSARQVSIPEGVPGYYIVKTARDAAAAIQ